MDEERQDDDSSDSHAASSSASLSWRAVPGVVLGREWPSGMAPEIAIVTRASSLTPQVGQWDAAWSMHLWWHSLQMRPFQRREFSRSWRFLSRFATSAASPRSRISLTRRST